MDTSNKLIVLTHKYGSEDLYIQIPLKVRKDLNWKEGDTLVWEIEDDNSIIIRKESKDANINEATKEDWEDFWYESESEGKDIDYDAIYDSYIQKGSGS